MTAAASSAVSAPRIGALDGVRGLAVVAVVAMHAGVAGWGWIGVDIFFALSGLLITGILLDAKPMSGGGAWAGYGKPFYLRRLLRIVPLAWAFLAVLFLIAPALGLTPPVPWAEQVRYWAFLSNTWLGLRSPTAWMAAHFWSLAVEEQFYLVWPWLVLVTPRARLGAVLRTLLVGAVLARVGIVLLHLPPQVGHVYQDFTLTRMDGLVAGSLVAVLAREGEGLMPHRRAAALCLALSAGLFVLLHRHASTTQAGFVLRYAAIAAASASALLLLLAHPDGWAARVLETRWLTWLGARSYGIYVIHLPIVMWLARRGLPAWEVFALSLAATTALAAISWVALERPFLALKSRYRMGDAGRPARG